MIQYLINMKYKGNPKPINYNYLELLRSGISFLTIGLRQQGQKTWLELIALVFNISVTPGLLA